jgi:hypothetical protein
MRLVLFCFALAALAVAASAGSAWTQDVCSDSVYAEVEGGQITVHHTGALYNCCLTTAYDVLFPGAGRIDITERETGSTPCYCECCFDLYVRIADVPPGEYLVGFLWYDYETGGWQERRLVVVVPEAGQCPCLPVSDYLRSDCGGWTAVPPEGGESAATWSAIKTLYR